MEVLRYLLLVNAFLLTTFVRHAVGTPERPDCSWAKAGEVERMRDLSDCSKFYYCVQGMSPYQGSCPTDNNFYLFYNPETQHCDFCHRAHPDCRRCGGGGGYYVDPTTTTTTTTTTTEPPSTMPPTTTTTTEPTTTTTTEPTTTQPTTTTRAPRPPQLNDQGNYEINCAQRVCGIFPNAGSTCDTYVVCVNGQKQIKKCNGGQLFDVRTNECQPATAATCWAEPDAGPHRLRTPKVCPYHNYEPANPPFRVETDGWVLQNPIITNLGVWQKWVYCPKGMYATGIYAWRRLLKEGMSLELHDHAGIVSMSYLCQTPGGNETSQFIESLGPGVPHDGWPFYYMCTGAVVGMRLNSAKNGIGAQGRDFIGTDNVQAMCSCSAPAFKPYDEPQFDEQRWHRGIWTAEQNCRKGQAVCGMQNQHTEYKERMIGKFDNTGMHNMKVKCCDVPNPLDTCVPQEKRFFVRTCDNTMNDENQKCQFEGEVGLSLDTDNQLKLINFYTSIGYGFEESKANLSKRIEKELTEKIQAGTRLEYDWDDATPSIFQDPVVITQRKMYVKPRRKTDLYQIVGTCGYFIVRTNRYVRVSNPGGEEFFEV